MPNYAAIGDDGSLDLSKLPDPEAAPEPLPDQVVPGQISVDYDLAPHAGPYQAILDAVPVENAFANQDHERSLEPLKIIANNAIGLVTGDMEAAKSETTGEAIAIDEGTDAWLKFKRGEEIAVQKLAAFKQTLEGKGLIFTGSLHDLREGSSAYLAKEIGPAYRLEAGPEALANLSTMGMLHTAVVNSQLSADREAEVAGLVQAKIAPSLKVPRQQTPVEFTRDMATLRVWRDSSTNPAMHICGSDPQLDAANLAIANSWYESLTGVKADGISEEDKRSAINGVLYAHEGLMTQHRAAMKWQAVGVSLGPKDVNPDGSIKIAQMPFYGATLDKVARNQMWEMGDGDRVQLGHVHAREKMRKSFFEAPARILTQIIPEAEQDPVLRDFVSSIVGQATQIADPQERDQYIRRTLNQFTQGERQPQTMDWIKGQLADRSRYTEDQWKVLKALPERLEGFEIAYAADDVQRMGKLDQIQPTGWDPAVARQRAAVAREQNNAEYVRAQKFAESLADAPITNFTFGVLNAFATLVDKAGITKVSGALLKPAIENAVEAAFLEPLPENAKLFQPVAPSVMQRFTREALGYGHDIRETQERYAQRVANGEATWLDDLWLTFSTLGDGMARLPEMAGEDPLGFAAIGGLMGAYAKGGAKLAEAARKAGMPVRLVGALQFASNPMSLQGLGKMMGTSMELARKLGGWAPSVARSLNKLADRPEEAAAMATYWDGYTQSLRSRMGALRTPAETIRSVENSVAALRAKAERGQVTTTDLWNLDLQGLSDVQIRQLFAPFTRSRLSVGSGGLEGILQHTEALNSLSRLETGLISDKTLKLPKPLAGLFVDALNAHREGQYPVFRKLLTSRLMRTLMPGVVKRLGDYLDTRINISDAAPHAMQGVDAAMLSLQLHRERARDLAITYDYGMKLAQTRREALKSDLGVLEYRQQIQQHWSPYLTGMEGRVSELQNEIALTKQRIDLTHNMEAQFQRHILELNNLAGVKIQGQQGMVGLEAGHKNYLTGEARSVLGDAMIELAQDHGAAGLMMLGLPTTWVEHINRAEAGVELALGRADKRLDVAVMALRRGRPARAAKLLGLELPKNPEKINDAVWAAVEARWEKNAADRANRQALIRREAHATLEDQFNLPALDQIQTWTLQRVRQNALAMQSMASMKGGPGSTMLELLAVSEQGSIRNKAMGQLDVYSAGQANTVNLQFNRQTRRYHALDPQARDALNKHARDPGSVTTEEQAAILFDDARMRNDVLDMQVKRGIITAEDAQRYRLNPYEDHYYLNQVEANKLRELGVLGQREKLDAPNIKESEFEALQPQRSFRHARVRVKGAEPEFFYIKDHGSAKEANAAARAWMKEKIAKHELRESDVMGRLDPAFGPDDAALLGLLDSDGALRIDRIRQLYADTFRNDFFAQVSMIPGLKRQSIADLPLTRQGEWTGKALEGKEWGALEGFHLHKSVLRMMNTWDNWHEVIQNVSDNFKRQVAEVYQPTGMVEKMLYGEESTSRIAAFGRRVDRLWRTNLIVRNIGSWVNNHLGGMTSAYLSGANPLDPRFWEEAHRFNVLLEDVTKGGKAKNPKDPLDPHVMFEEAASIAGLTSSGGVLQPGKVRGEYLPMKRWIDRAAQSLREKQSQALYKLQQTDQAITNLRDQIAKEAYSPSRLERAEEQLQRWDALHKDQVAELHKLNMSELGTIATGLENFKVEAKRALLDPERSTLSQIMGDQYSLIDPRYRYATYAYLRKVKGMSKERALDMLADTFQNYATVPPWVRQLQKHPLGAFVPSFAYEAQRVIRNAMYYDPAKLMAFVSAPFIANMANMAANGISPQEYLMDSRATTTFDQIVELFGKVRVDMGGYTFKLNLGQTGFFGPFMSSTGLAKPAVQAWQQAADQALPGVLSAPLAAITNFATNFVVNKPTLSVGAKFLGFDAYKGEVSYSRYGDVGPVGDLGKDLAGMLTPRTFMRLHEEVASMGQTSLVTGHNKGLAQAVVRSLTGQPLTARPASEMFAGLLMKYSRIENVSALIRPGRAAAEEAAAAAALKAGLEADPIKKATLLKEAAVLEQAAHEQTTLVGKRQLKVGISKEQALKNVIQSASRNLFAEIEKIPIEKLPLALVDVMDTSLAKARPSEVAHMWRQFTPEYLASRSDLAELGESFRLLAQLGDSSLRDTTRAQFMTSGVHVARRMKDVMMSQYSSNQVDLLKKKMGAWPAAQAKMLMIQLGL